MRPRGDIKLGEEEEEAKVVLAYEPQVIECHEANSLPLREVRKQSIIKQTVVSVYDESLA